jgi:hypothetical protein
LAKAPSEKTLEELAEDMHMRPEGPDAPHGEGGHGVTPDKRPTPRNDLHVRGFNRDGGVRSSGCDHRGHRGLCRLPWRMSGA